MNQEEVARRIGTKFALEGMAEEQLDEYIRWFFATALTQTLMFEANQAYHDQMAADAEAAS